VKGKGVYGVEIHHGPRSRPRPPRMCPRSGTVSDDSELHQLVPAAGPLDETDSTAAHSAAHALYTCNSCIPRVGRELFPPRPNQCNADAAGRIQCG
jgi:hypothetical protein